MGKVTLSHPESAHQLILDEETGLLGGLIFIENSVNREVSIASTITLQIDGSERRAATGGLEYFDTKKITDSKSKSKPQQSVTDDGVEWRIQADLGGVLAEYRYALNRKGPGFTASVNFPGDQKVLIRNFSVTLSVNIPKDVWKVQIPGNGLRNFVPLQSVTSGVGVSPLGGLRGSSGLILAISEANGCVALWPDNRVEIPLVEFKGTGENSYTVNIDSNFGSDLKVVNSVELPLFSADLSANNWDEFPEIFDGWLRAKSITSPNKPPAWINGSMIYEAQIGFSVFNEKYKYSPYPEVSDLIADLDRVKAMGFSCIQLMPRQPYPSYNIHDYWDIDTSYGPKDLMVELVKQCHSRGIRIILDILLHGVLDKEIIKKAADGVRSGPYANLISADTADSFAADVNDWDNYLIAWSRHILDFEKYWYEGSPAVSPLIEEHPDWFYRDSANNVQGVYTKAFDASNRDWQNYFIEACRFLMTELDIDGFRFDAPSYNDFPNWADWSRGRAGASALGCLGLFERLRPVMKSIKSDSLLYTEPSGHSFRQSMDLNYNYDEQWLVTAICDSSARAPWGIAHAKDLAGWFESRNAMLPRGSVTAHHIDSHDTFWWPSWGKKWRREQFTLAQVKLLTLVFATLPGPFMMFSGGEIGIEELLPKISKTKQLLLNGEDGISWWTEEWIPNDVFLQSRSTEGKLVIVAANFSDQNQVIKDPRIGKTASVLVQAGEQSQHSAGTLSLPPFSGVILSIESA
jgi:hypothetical protein